MRVLAYIVLVLEYMTCFEVQIRHKEPFKIAFYSKPDKMREYFRKSTISFSNTDRVDIIGIHG